MVPLVCEIARRAAGPGAEGDPANSVVLDGVKRASSRCATARVERESGRGDIRLPLRVEVSSGVALPARRRSICGLGGINGSLRVRHGGERRLVFLDLVFRK